MKKNEFTPNGVGYIQGLIACAVKNVYGRGTAAIALAGEIGNLIIYGVECADGTVMIEDNR